MAQVVTSDTDYIDSLLAPGGNITIPSGTYTVDYIRPRSDSLITIEPGTSFIRGSSPYSLLDMQNISDTHIAANGAIFDATLGASQTSHNVKMLGTVRCTLADADIRYTKGAKDCVYIGLGEKECYESKIIGGSILNGGRNGVSIIAGIRCVIDGVDISGSNVTGPGAGVDLEANNHEYMNIDNEVINCSLHNNRYGVLTSFGERTVIRNNDAYDNSHAGIGVTSSGNTRKFGIARTNIDLMGIVSFDPATNSIEVGGELARIPPGTPVTLSPRNGAVLPTGISSGGYAVVEHGPGNTIKIGDAVGVNVRKFFDTGSGNLNASSDLSDIVLSVKGAAGQSDRPIVTQNRCYRNGREGIYGAFVSHAAIYENECYENAGYQIRMLYCYKPTVRDNIIRDGLTTGGAAMSVCHGSDFSGNKIENVNGYGVLFSGVSDSVLADNVVINSSLDNYQINYSANVRDEGNI